MRGTPRRRGHVLPRAYRSSTKKSPGWWTEAQDIGESNRGHVSEARTSWGCLSPVRADSGTAVGG